ncbi:conserved hypothetical protein [Plantibacter sp. T3]|uniref:hypothetical protein n=1 Tax=Plantibacter flavus TaxID=150123 RepID=UPI0012F4323F|nr:conserved hypothetical protein [Plantibacter sp. T3]
MIEVLDAVSTSIVAAPYCMPEAAQNALDTGVFWMRIVAVSLGVIALIMIGIGMFYSARRGDGGEMLSKLGWFIAGLIVVSAAAGIVSIFLATPTGCTPGGV